MDAIASFFGRNGFLPHGYCFQWSPNLLWAMVVADVAIALAYFSIPLALVSFIRRRPGLRQQLGGVPWLFSAFIFACGLTHVMGVWTLWQPDYGLEALTKAGTAGLSVVTALALWPLIPRALKIPSVLDLQSAIARLEAEIGRRRSAEQHALDIEQSLAVTLASIEAGFIATDRAGRVTRMNEVAERITGWTQAEALGRSVMEVYDREGRPPELAASNAVDLVLQRGPAGETVHDAVCIARDGRRTTVELRSGIKRDDNGAVRGLVTVFRDVTLSRQAEAELPRLAAIVESSDDAIIGCTLDGRISSWNRAAEGMFGQRAQDAIGTSIEALYPPGGAVQPMEGLQALARGERIPAFDAVGRSGDGRRLDLSVSLSPVLDRRGRIVGASKIVRDMSERRRDTAALRESEARLRFTLEAGQVGSWDMDLETGVIRRSLMHDRCFGYDEPVAHWTPADALRHMHPEDRGAFVDGFADAMATGQDWRPECRVIWPDGSLHWVAGRGSLFSDGNGRRRMLGIISDITQSKLAEQGRLLTEQLAAENRQIQAASRMKSQFLANMSHELRTPLNAVIGFADLLHAGAVPADSPKHREFLGHIGSSGRHLLQLINDVLDLSKVETGHLEFFVEPVDLPKLMADVGAVLFSGKQAQRLQFTLQVDPALAEVDIDPGRFKQALFNYLSNAIKFTPDGGKVTVRAMPDGDAHMRLEVEDTGIGIAAEDLPRLFVEFQQLDAGLNKQHAGTGLGLALTRSMVEAQGGTVGVRSVLGQGSVFHLVLPCTAAQLPVRPRRLLLLDDPAHGAVAGSLGAAGFAVDVAASGQDALRHAATHAYDGITLGLDLPDRSGLGVLAALRQTALNQATRVVGLSIATDAQARVLFPITDLLEKPLLTDQVLQALAACGLQRDSGACVMVIDDDPLALALMDATLRSAGLRPRRWTDGRQALRELDAVRPAAIVLDLMMPGFDGFDVLQALSTRPDWQAIPVFVWTSMLLTDPELADLAQSAQAILQKGGGGLALLVQRLLHAGPAATAAAPAPVDDGALQ